MYRITRGFVLVQSALISPVTVGPRKHFAFVLERATRLYLLAVLLQ